MFLILLLCVCDALTFTDKPYKHFVPNLKLKPPTRKKHQTILSSYQLPLNFDWRDFNVVTPVKNQGNCGSCYTFAAAGVLEYWASKRAGSLISISEQQLLSCNNTDGCDGGWVESIFAYAARHNISSEKEQPYQIMLWIIPQWQIRIQVFFMQKFS